jgi:hypothetical protein
MRRRRGSKGGEALRRVDIGVRVRLMLGGRGVCLICIGDGRGEGKERNRDLQYMGQWLWTRHHDMAF